MEYQHLPVALDRVIEILAPVFEKDNNEKLMIDATLGLGGHTYALLERFPNLKIIGFDRDEVAQSIAKEKLAKFTGRAILVNDRFDSIDKNLDQLLSQGVIEDNKIDAALFDLGVSSMQLDDAERGFSYIHAGPLDMRMNPKDHISAFEVVNNYSKNELVRILRNYGDEKFAPRIADFILEARAVKPIQSTIELAEIVKEAIPAPARRQGGNPAKRTFQAIRIEVNQELESIKSAIPQSLAALKVSGRVVVLAYQSLEDKLVKVIFQEYSKNTDLLALPIALPGSAPKYKVLKAGSELASETEIKNNPRAASLRLRAIERLVA
jgi:16S rRNA (cytosine1402-N4)-methyltransferase